MSDWGEYAKLFAGLVAIVNPIGAIPLFISLTEGEGERQRAHTANRAALSVWFVLTVALVTGETLLKFFGISIASFRVGGGVLILIIAVAMMHARTSTANQTEEERLDAAEKESVGVVPLGVPLLAGPGAISTVILYASRDPSLLNQLILASAIFAVALVVWVCFRAAPAIGEALGRTGVNVVTRIMGLILASIAVEIMASGLRQLFPGLA